MNLGAVISFIRNASPNVFLVNEKKECTQHKLNVCK